MSTKMQQASNGAAALGKVQDKIIILRNQHVLLDSEVAALYGVETREVNQAIKNNPSKFPKGYVIELKSSEFHELRSKFLTAKLEKTRVLPKAFTEKGAYMLATILKSPRATQATLDIVEAFARLRELSRLAADMVNSPDDAEKQASFMKKTGEVLSDVITRDLKTTATETTFELNLASAIKIKHTIKREAK